MKSLYENGFITPEPIDANRHGILMSYIDGYTFQRIKHLEPTIVEKTYHFLLDLAIRLAEHGLIHSDFNEYNILIDDKEPYQVYVIDFPQMVSTDHKEAKMFFDRDIACIERLFRKKHNFTCERIAQISFEEIKQGSKRLDQEAKASGYWKQAGVKAKEVTAMEAVLERGGEDDVEGEEEGEEEQEDTGQDQEGSEDSQEIAEGKDNNESDVDEQSEEEEQEDNIEEIKANEGLVEPKIEEAPVKKIGWGPAKPKISPTTQHESSKPLIEDKKSLDKENTIEEKTKISKEEIKEGAPQEQVIKGDESSEGEANEQEQGEEYKLTPEEQEKQDKYIKRALKKKFKKKKTFKTNKNKMKAITALNKEVVY